VVVVLVQQGLDNMNQVPPTLGYTQGTGSSSSNPFIEFFSDRDPTTNDTNYPIQKRWFNVTSNVEWILVSFTTTNATLQANWQEITTASEALLQFTAGNGATGSFPVFPKPTNPNEGSISLNTTNSPLANRLSIVGGNNSLTLSLLATPITQLVVGLTQVSPTTSGLVSLTSSAGSITITPSTSNLNFDISGFTPLTTYTPVLSSSGGGEIVSYTGTPTGSFSVTNGICTIGFLIVATVSGSPSGSLQISLPFTCTRQVCFGIGRVSIGGSSNWIGPYQIQFSNSVCNILDAVSGSLVTMTTTTYNLAATITYFVG
jgi:hypothetical protein